MRLLLTGAAGFAGSHIVEEMVREKYEVIALDCLTYAARLGNLLSPPAKFVWHDFRYPLSDVVLKEIGQVDVIIHNGAESHVARSFQHPLRFLESNAIGTMNVLEAARKLQLKRFIYISTDEVFGDRQTPATEDDVLNPSNPYSATKAAGELLAQSYHHAYGLPVIITHCMNMFGERQHPEKFVPMAIRKILRGEMLDIHGRTQDADAGWCSDARKWLYVRNEVSALSHLIRHGLVGQKYNIAGEERTNLDMAKQIAKMLDKPLSWRPTKPSGPPRDQNYAVSDTKIRALGWKPPHEFEAALEKTVRWYAEHQEYLEG